MKKRAAAFLLSMVLGISLMCTAYADQTTSLNTEGDTARLEYTDPNPLPPPPGSVVEEEDPVEEPVKQPAEEQKPVEEPVEKPIANPFVDVSPNDYFYDAVLWAVGQEIIGSTGSGRFNPDTICSRAETVTFLWRAAGSPKPTNTQNPFTDLLPGDYYYDAVLWAVEQGITNGIATSSFSPGDTVNRAQAVTFLFRAMKAQSVSGSNPFTDISKDNYYYDTVLWAVENGITNGNTSTQFAPALKCTRARIVTFLYRAQSKT